MDSGAGGDSDARWASLFHHQVRRQHNDQKIAACNDPGFLTSQDLSGDIEDETGMGRLPDGSGQEEARCSRN